MFVDDYGVAAVSQMRCPPGTTDIIALACNRGPGPGVPLEGRSGRWGVLTAVHGMRRHLKDAVKGQLLVDEVEEVTPVPGIVLHYSMGIKLDPDVEHEQRDAYSPATQEDQGRLTLGNVGADKGEEAVGHKVTHQNQIDEAAEDEPGIVLERSVLKLVVLGDLCLQLLLEQVVEPCPGLPSGGGVHKQPPAFGPRHHQLTVGLFIEQDTDANVVRGAPEDEDGGHDWLLEVVGQGIGKQDVQRENHENDGIGEVLGLPGVKELADHVVGDGDDEDYGRQEDWLARDHPKYTGRRWMA